MDIIDQLEGLGLNNKLARAYLAILKFRKANANQIAIEAKIQRTTIYNVLKELEEKQLISQSREGKRIIYWAESPVNFQNVLFRQLETFKGLLPILSSLEGRVEFKPTIKYYEGRQSILSAYWDSLKCQEKLFRNVAAVSNIEKLLGSQFINRYTEERITRGILTRSLRANSERDEMVKSWYLKNDNREVLRENRYLPEEISIDAFVKTYDDIVMLITFNQTPSMIVIESPALAQTVKALFDIAWLREGKIKPGK